MARRQTLLLLLLVASSLGAEHRTQNFVVRAPTPEIARQVGEFAEQYRRQKALQWLGSEMPAWGQPCPLRVTVTPNGSGGATSFAFDRGSILSQDMHIEGTLERLLSSVLPHEVTHTVFAYHFRQPVPRWADEGGSVLSEDELERSRHDRLVRQILNTRGRRIPLRRLFALKEYPNDVMALYAQGFSVSEFLVLRSSRPAFLNFVADGMKLGWDQAAKAHYGFGTVEQLEAAWIQFLQTPRGQRQDLIAARTATQGEQRGLAASPSSQHIVVRQTVPPAQPLLDTPRPIYRGAAPGPEDTQGSQPYQPTSFGSRGDCPNGSCPPGTPPTVRLGAPQFGTVSPAQLRAPIPGPGYPQ